MDRLSDVQRDMLVPRIHPRGVRAPRFSWPPEHCPCCGQKWPISVPPPPDGCVVAIESHPNIPGVYVVKRDGEPAESARTIVRHDDGSESEAPEGMFE